MTVGRSEQAKTEVVDWERKVRREVGWVPRVTFFGGVKRGVRERGVVGEEEVGRKEK